MPNKFGGDIVVADKRAICQMANMYAPSIQMDTVRRQVYLEVQMRAHSVTADASDAYHQGAPPDSISEHERFIFVRPLAGLEKCGLGHMNNMVWQVTGNVPGIQNAGVVWGDHFGGYSARGTRRAWSIVASFVGATKTTRSRSSACT